MFDHVELVIPPTDHVENAVDAVMRHVMRRRNAWCDFYFVGGAWNGLKQTIGLDLRPFAARLDELSVTVSKVKWYGSRDMLQPEEQAAVVDAEWRRFYPGLGESCPLFAQYKGPRDINWCPVADTPEKLTADRLVIARPTGRQRIVHMLNEEALGRFDHAIRPALRSLQASTPNTPADDWLVVTLCCHW